jgi:hypothetical protein
MQIRTVLCPLDFSPADRGGLAMVVEVCTEKVLRGTRRPVSCVP